MKEETGFLKADVRAVGRMLNAIDQGGVLQQRLLEYVEAALVAGFERLLTRYRAAYPDGEPGARAPRIDRRRNKGRPRAPRSKSQSVKAP